MLSCHGMFVKYPEIKQETHKLLLLKNTVHLRTGHLRTGQCFSNYQRKIALLDVSDLIDFISYI